MDIAEGELVDVRDKIFAVLGNFTGFTYEDFFARTRAEIENFKRCGEFKINACNIKKERLTVVDENVEPKEKHTEEAIQVTVTSEKLPPKQPACRKPGRPRKTSNPRQSKRLREQSSLVDDKQFNSEPKRSKSLKEDDNFIKPADTTFVVEKIDVIADQTVVEKPTNRTIVANKMPVCITVSTPLNTRVDLNDLMTDDEDETVPTKSRVSRVVKAKSKAIVSTYECNSVTAQVEALEKLNDNNAVDQPPRMTRTKTKAKQAKEQQQHDKATSLETPASIPPVKDKSKATTPSHQNLFRPTAFSTAFKPLEPASAQKKPYHEFVELKKQKEDEAMRKREMVLLAKKEASMQKQEEKQIKAQQARAAKEKDLQKMLDQKLREEAEAKRLHALIKAREVNRTEKEEKPIYLEQSAPYLPTEDCYDSDDECRGRNKVNKPSWARRQNMYPVLQHIYYIGAKVKNTLFMCEATTPDLRELFSKITPSKLKRTSSAVWRKQPRFTIMPIPSVNNLFEDKD